MGPSQADTNRSPKLPVCEEVAPKLGPVSADMAPPLAPPPSRSQSQVSVAALSDCPSSIRSRSHSQVSVAALSDCPSILDPSILPTCKSEEVVGGEDSVVLCGPEVRGTSDIHFDSARSAWLAGRGSDEKRSEFLFTASDAIDEQSGSYPCTQHRDSRNDELFETPVKKKKVRTDGYNICSEKDEGKDTNKDLLEQVDIGDEKVSVLDLECSGFCSSGGKRLDDDFRKSLTYEDEKIEVTIPAAPEQKFGKLFSSAVTSLRSPAPMRDRTNIVGISTP